MAEVQGEAYTHRKKVAYEEPFRVLEQDTYMEPLKVLQRTPSQGFFKEPLPMVLQRTPKGTSENPERFFREPTKVLQRTHEGTSKNP